MSKGSSSDIITPVTLEEYSQQQHNQVIYSLTKSKNGLQKSYSKEIVCDFKDDFLSHDSCFVVNNTQLTPILVSQAALVPREQLPPSSTEPVTGPHWLQVHTHTHTHTGHRYTYTHTAATGTHTHTHTGHTHNCTNRKHTHTRTTQTHTFKNSKPHSVSNVFQALDCNLISIGP